MKEHQAKYKLTDKGKETEKRYRKSDAKKAANRRYRDKNEYKHLAHQYLYIAIKSGLITRKPCLFCGSSETEGHHEDYSKPLEVIWLCPKCHAKIHRVFKGGDK